MPIWKSIYLKNLPQTVADFCPELYFWLDWHIYIYQNATRTV